MDESIIRRFMAGLVIGLMLLALVVGIIVGKVLL